MLIRLKGTPDGFNTEQSERLHIDCAKEGYRASNKKEYTDQMVRYLTRQEYIHSFASYLSWLEDVAEGVPEPIEDENEDPLSLPPELPATKASEDETEAIEAESGLTWRIAKKIPLPHTPVQYLIKEHGAADIVPALTKYLQENVPQCRVTPTEHDQYDVYKKITADIPSIQRLTNETIRDVIRATPAVNAKGRKKGEPAHFDCLLVHDKPDAEDVGLQGYRAARIRVIFRLPQYFRCNELLAYVEWYTPFSKPIMPLRMSEVTYSMRNGSRVGAVIQVASIRRSCHLIPKFGKPSRQVDRRVSAPWTSDTILDQHSRFFFNSQFSLDMFQFCDGDYELVEE
ncbi:hypothetical protein M422DRAFT_245497 [Sphaerobolus stellatus SS14]|nr:hypothetical protein M422DRAFT_245497 [Sphaerobolus stellatus SS14]